MFLRGAVSRYSLQGRRSAGPSGLLKNTRTPASSPAANFGAKRRARITGTKSICVRSSLSCSMEKQRWASSQAHQRSYGHQSRPNRFRSIRETEYAALATTWRLDSLTVRGNSSSVTIFHFLRHRISGTDDTWAATGHRRPQLNISNSWDLQALPPARNQQLFGYFWRHYYVTNDCPTAKSSMFISAVTK